ncbi:unnamed protein product, partial [Vitis vinifera]
MVRRSAPIWSCSSCYSIFHLNCIKKWARAPTSTDFSVEKNQGVNWRCPGCQSVQLTASKEIRYVCFCGKRSDPPSDLYLTPHSCGEPCGKPLNREIIGSGESNEDFCPHVCVLQCHPGPCPPCKAFAPPRLCPCRKKIITTRCSDRKSVLTCGQRCDKLLECGRHRCERMCHVGACDPCQVLVNASCFCKNTVEVVLCGSMAVKGELKSEDGVFSCRWICGKKLFCGNHDCDEICHPGPCGDCNLMPSRIRTCYCGKTSLQEERRSCLDPIPTCLQIFSEASIIQKLPVPLQPVEANGRKIPLGQRKLACDDECAKQERKRVLADAFDITPPNLDALHFGETSVVSELLADLFRRDPKWVLSVEERCKFLVLGKTRGTTSSLRVHVFCPMLKEKRDAVRLIAERWKLSVNSAGWEPKRFIVVHVTPKSKAPARVLGAKGSTPLNVLNPPVFDPLVDMDPRLVVSLLDLPRDADISALVLRFGGECELVWLNDKNALAVFSDPARAATAMRRLDHGSVYHGAVVIPQNGIAPVASQGANAWGGSAGGMAKEGRNQWKKAVVQESGWSESSWGGEDWSAGSVDLQASVWKGKESPIVASVNRWNVLEPELVSSSSTSSVKTEDSGKRVGNQSVPADASEVVDDWEKAYE